MNIPQTKWKRRLCDGQRCVVLPREWAWAPERAAGDVCRVGEAEMNGMRRGMLLQALRVSARLKKLEKYWQWRVQEIKKSEQLKSAKSTSV